MRIWLKYIFFIIALLLGPMALSPALVSASFNPLGSACQSNQSANSSATCQQANSQGTTNPISGPNGIISDAANLIALVAGVAAVIMISISGLSFVTSAGNTEAATKARQRIIGAVIGLIVIALAWVIVRYVTDNVISIS